MNAPLALPRVHKQFFCAQEEECSARRQQLGPSVAVLKPKRGIREHSLVFFRYFFERFVQCWKTFVFPTYTPGRDHLLAHCGRSEPPVLRGLGLFGHEHCARGMGHN